MTVPNSWIPVLRGDEATQSDRRLSALDRVRAAIAGARRGQADESLDDVIETASMAMFDTQVNAILAVFAAMRDAANVITHPNSASRFADPLLVAAIQRFPPPEGVDTLTHAERVVELHLKIRDLVVNENATPQPMPKPQGRPAPHRNNPSIRAAVRAATHCCFDELGKYSGGWRSDRVPGTTKAGSKREDDEFSPKGPAGYVASLVRAAGVSAELRDIKGYMDEYGKELRNSRRSPVLTDYMPDHPDEVNNE